MEFVVVYVSGAQVFITEGLKTLSNISACNSDSMDLI